MTISELICQLQQIKCEHGDLHIAIQDEFGDIMEAKYVTTVSNVRDLNHKGEYAVIEAEQ